MARARVPETKRKPRVQAAPAPSRRGLDRRWWLAIGAVAVAIVAVLVTVSVLSAGSDEETGSGDGAPAAGTTLPGADEVAALLGGLPQDGEALGEPESPVTLVVYADPQCPACAAFAVETLPDLIETYVRPGDLRIVYRGVAIIGPDSETGLSAAYAAGLQDKLWQFSDLTYLNQGEENSGWLDDEFVRAAASSVRGLDVERLLRDRESAEVEELLAAARSDAEEIGLQGTPTFQVGSTGGSLGEPLLGGDFHALSEVIDPLLE